MFAEYIQAALSKATYSENLKGVIEGWIALRLRLGLAIPPANGHAIEIPSQAEAVV